MTQYRMAACCFPPRSATFHLTLVAAIACPLAVQLAEVHAQQPVATKVEYSEGENGTLVTVVAVDRPELRCDVWCYEDRLGKPVAHEKDGETLILAHREGKAKVTSRFVPLDDGVEIHVKVSGPEAEAVKAVGSLNPCCQFRHSDAFRNRKETRTSCCDDTAMISARNDA